jgi:putative hemolysin
MEVKMFMKRILSLIFVAVFMFLAACAPQQASPTPTPNLPNPVSVYCGQNGGRLDLRPDAAGGVAGICVFPDGSECDEWAYSRGECAPAGQGDPTTAPIDPPDPTSPPASDPTAIPTPVPIDPAGYQGWWTYTHPIYGFTIMLPEDWIADETTTVDALMNGHLLNFRSRDGVGNLNIRMTFRKLGEDFPLWPTGVGSGEFVPQGTLEVAGQPVRRILFVCPTGQVSSVWYHGEEGQANIRRGDLEFGFIFSSDYCQAGISMTGKVQFVGEMIIASLQVP